MPNEKLLTGRGGELHAQIWMGDAAPQGIVVMVHGLGDHSDRFSAFADHMTASGWAVMAFDLPGHGRSPGTPGRIKSFDSIMEDIAAARQTASERLPGLPQVLMGHSMGGNFVLNYALRRDQFDRALLPLRGLALCAPMLLPPRPMPRPVIFAAWLTGHLIPWFRFDREIDIEALTGDPDQAQAIEQDPLMHSKISMYLATQLVSQGRWAIDQAREIDLPTLVMFGENDSLIDQSACQNLAIRMGASATLVSWPEVRHALFHDRDHEFIVRRIGTWLGSLETD